MYFVLMSLGDRPAAEGIGSVIMSVLTVIGTLALIYVVLVLLDRYHKKHGGDDSGDTAQPPQQASDKSFQQVLSDEIRRNDEKNGSGRA